PLRREAGAVEARPRSPSWLAVSILLHKSWNDVGRKTAIRYGGLHLGSCASNNGSVHVVVAGETQRNPLVGSLGSPGRRPALDLLCGEVKSLHFIYNHPG